jgi:hypothetical protein
LRLRSAPNKANEEEADNATLYDLNRVPGGRAELDRRGGEIELELSGVHQLANLPILFAQLEPIKVVTTHL